MEKQQCSRLVKCLSVVVSTRLVTLLYLCEKGSFSLLVELEDGKVGEGRKKKLEGMRSKERSGEKIAGVLSFFFPFQCSFICGKDFKLAILNSS